MEDEEELVQLFGTGTPSTKEKQKIIHRIEVAKSILQSITVQLSPSTLYSPPVILLLKC